MGLRTGTSRLGRGASLTRFGPPNEEWTPLNLGSALVAWYDATDAASITQSSGAVSAWNDKSASGYHLIQGTAANKPTYSATGFQSNSPGITFDGSNDYLAAASATIGTDKLSVFMHAQFKSGFALNYLGYHANGDAGPFSANSSVIIATSGANTELQSVWRAAAKSTVPAAKLKTTGYYRIATIFDSSNNTFYLDNAYVATPVAATGSLNTPGTILLGARSGGSQAWNGTAGELIILNRDATSDERAKIDTFLLRKWPRVLVCEGDSITALDADTPRFPQLFIPNSNPSVYLDDIAVPGTDFNTNIGSLVEGRTPLLDAHLPSNKRGRQYVLFFTFANQINGSVWTDPLTTLTAAQKAAMIGDYCLARKAAGWDKVVIATFLSRTDASQANDTFRNQINAVITGVGWKETYGIDAICDFAGDAIMGVNASPTVNPTYWADDVHPNAAGFARLEIILRATINGL